jgi:hypothetical protein
MSANILYCNSDSYGVLTDTPDGNRYSDYLGQMIKAEQVINNGLPGSCNQRIIRTTVRDLLQIKSQNANGSILAVICLGSLYRNEWWDPDFKPPFWCQDGHFQSFQVAGFSTRIEKHKEHYQYAKEWYRVFNDEAEQTSLLMWLNLLTAWLQTNGINYIIFAGNTVTYKKIDYNSIFVKDFAATVAADVRILPFHDFSFASYCVQQGFKPYDFDQYQNNGHHGDLAHKKFAEYLFSHYKKIQT